MSAILVSLPVADLDCGLEFDPIASKSRHKGPVDGLCVYPPKIGIAAICKPKRLDMLHLANVVHHAIHSLQGKDC